MQEKVKPVDGPDQLAFYQHLQFFPHVGRMKGGKTDGQAGDDKYPPGEGCENFFHLIVLNLLKCHSLWYIRER